MSFVTNMNVHKASHVKRASVVDCTVVTFLKAVTACCCVVENHCLGHLKHAVTETVLFTLC